MSLPEKSKRRIRLSTSHQRSKDSSLRRDSEERRSRRETSSLPSKQRRKLELSMIRFFLKLLRKERLSTTRKMITLVRKNLPP